MNRNPRMEQALVGTALGFPTDVYTVTDVRPQDMAYASHQFLWTVILDLERRHSLSYQAVLEQLHAQNRIEDLGADVEDGSLTGEEYLKELLSRRAQPSIREFADAVVGASIKRQLKGMAQLLSLDTESEKEADELLDHAEEALYQLRRHHVDTGCDMGDLLAAYEKVMDDWRADRIVPAFTFTTPGLASLIPFLEPTDFVLIAGRPGEGKSSHPR
jgi:replicative DNA helicase